VVADRFDDDGHGDRSGRHPKHRQVQEVGLRGLPRLALTPGGQITVCALLVLESGADLLVVVALGIVARKARAGTDGAGNQVPLVRVKGCVFIARG
jgi:hypothetical protein